MKFLILTPSSLIIHENDKMSKVPQRYHEKQFKSKTAWNIVQINNWKIAQPIELKIEENWYWFIIMNNSWSWQWKTMKILYCLIVIHLTQKLSQILKLTYWLRNKEKYLVLTHSSLIIHEQWQNLKHAR